jgi:hypothetical protein
MQREAATVLVRKKGRDPAACGIQATRLVCRGHLREQMERRFLPCGPATEEQHGALGGFRHAHSCALDQGPRLETGRHGLAPEALPVPHHDDVAPRSDPVGPMRVLQGVLERGAIALAIAPQHHRRPQRDQCVPLLDQGALQVFGTVSLRAVASLPDQRQGAPCGDDGHHHRHTPAPHDAAIDDPHQRLEGARSEQDLGIRDTLAILRDLVVLPPPGKAFDAALGLRAIRHLGSDGGQGRPLPPSDAAHQRRQGRHVPGDRPGRLARIPWAEGGSSGMISAEVVAHGLLLLDWSRFPVGVYQCDNL